MARLAEELEGTGIGILLADFRGHIISRRSGERHVLDKIELAPRTGPEDAMLPVSGWADLTDTQRMVAELVIDGLTNRDAGAQLFLSPHTIDFHLRQIYRKLGVRSRVELARLAGPPRAKALPGPAALPIAPAQRDATLQGLGGAELLSSRNDQRLRGLADVTEGPVAGTRRLRPLDDYR